MSADPVVETARFPWSPLRALDTLWFQVAGTLCNLQCAHCFISCSPTNHSHALMSLETVRGHLEEARALGVKEYYFTGGEPFLNPELLEILEATLAQGPASVLTNGLLIKPDTAQRLRELSDASEYSLDLRVSLDGSDAASNDGIRGEGSFERILAGIRILADAGLNPVITLTEACEAAGTQAGRVRLLEFLGEIGLRQPRLKVMPLLRLGAEAVRTRGYHGAESLSGRSLTDAESNALQCTSCRLVSTNGVYVCPILLDFPDARMGATLGETLRPFELRYRACHTCHEQGLTCRT